MKRRNNKGQYTIDIHSHLMGFYLLCTSIAIGAYLQNHSKVMAYVDQMGAVDAESPHISSVYYPSASELQAEGWIDAKVVPLEELAEKIEPTKAPKQAQKSEVEQYIIEKFGEKAPEAFQVLECENKGLNPTAINHNRNKTTDHGIFQINSIHLKGKAKGKDLNNYKDNIDVAYAIYQDRGWEAWSCAWKVGVTPFWKK
jgi:hypothetical protein